MHIWEYNGMRIVAVVNQKGGCGKTTVSINLASALADMGKRVLLVDMDSQSHCAVGLAVPEEQIEQSIYDVLISESRNEPIRLTEILWQISDRLELAPASIDLSAFEQQMAGITDRESCLKKVLDKVSDKYDYVVIDCPPAVGLLTFNALRAATDVIVPVETGYFALHGLSKQLETLNILCKRCNQHVNVRVLASMYDIRTKMAREVLAELRSNFAEKMFRTVINFNTKIKEAASFGQPINEYDPASKGQRDFEMLAQETIGLEFQQQNKELVNSLAQQLNSIGSTANDLLKSAGMQKKQAATPSASPAPSPVQSVPTTPSTPTPAKSSTKVTPSVPATPSVKTVEAKPQQKPPQPQPMQAQAPQQSQPQQPPQRIVEIPAQKNPDRQQDTTVSDVATSDVAAVNFKKSDSIGGGTAVADAAVKTAAPSAGTTVTTVTVGKTAKETTKETAEKTETENKPQAVKPEASVKSDIAPKDSKEYNPEETDRKLADYYGASQVGDAVMFVSLYPRAGSVQLAGDFNNWQPETNPLKRVGDSGVWQAKLNLKQGRYRYRLVVDGKWQQDPYNEQTEMNPFGELNSIVEVK